MSQEHLLLLQKIEASLLATKKRVDELERAHPTIASPPDYCPPDGYENQDPNFQMELLHGEIPKTNPFDFDLCFQFQLPKYAGALKAETSRTSLILNEAAQKHKSGRHVAEVEKHQWNLMQQLTHAMAVEERRFNHFKNNILKKWAHPDAKADKKDHEIFKESAARMFASFMVSKEDKIDLTDFQVECLDSARACAIEMLLSLFHSQDFGYYTWMFTSIDLDELFLCVKMHDTSAKVHAHKSKFELPLDKKALEKLGISLVLERSHSWIHQKVIDSFMFGTDPETGQPVFDVPASVMYDPRLPDDWFMHHACEHDQTVTSIVTKIDSMRLMYDQITDKIDIDSMKRELVLKDWFPLHTAGIIHAEGGELPHWGKLWNKNFTKQPIDEIRKYFGASVALYFLFCEQLVSWFMVLLLAAFVLVCYDFYYCWPMLISGELALSQALGGHVVTPYARITFAFFTIFWCKAFSLSFERRLNLYSCKWGHLTAHVDDVKPLANPKFREMTEPRQSTLNANEWVHGVSYHDKSRGTVFSYALSLLLLCIGFLVDAFFLELQTYMRKEARFGNAAILGICLTIQIKVFNTVWGRIVPYFVKYEYHETLQAHCDACSKKCFYAQFLNTFGAFYYAAFLMQPLRDPALDELGSAWSYLAFALLIRYSAFVLLSLFTMVVPLLKMVHSLYTEEKKLRDASLLPKGFERLNFIEYQAKLQEYSAPDLNADYMKVLLPLGFVLCFGITYPLGTGLALVAFIVTIRLNAWKLLTLYRRPYPFKVQHGKWIWKQVIYQMLWIAEITNIALVSFVMAPFSSWEFQNQLLMFCALLAIYQFFSRLLNNAVSDVTPGVRLCLERQDYQQSKLTHYLYYTPLSMKPEKPLYLKPGAVELTQFLSIPGVYKSVCKVAKGLDATSGDDTEVTEGVLTLWSHLYGSIFRHGTYRCERDGLRNHQRETLLSGVVPDFDERYKLKDRDHRANLRHINNAISSIKNQSYEHLLDERCISSLQCQTTSETNWWVEMPHAVLETVLSH